MNTFVPNVYVVLQFKNIKGIRLLNTFSTNQFIFDNDDMQYIKYAKQFSEFCTINFLFRKCGNKKDLVGISVNALDLGVLRTIWAKSLTNKRIIATVLKYPTQFA